MRKIKKYINKLLCKLGFHNFTSKIQDFLDEFGYVPLDGKIPKNSKCSRCDIKYK